jgi:hypothetical protein
MLGLRWILGIATTIALSGWLALSIVGGGFRRSFGASEIPAWKTLLPLLVGALVIASVLWPERRTLLHVVAAIMMLLAIGSLALARETVFVATLGILYAAIWLTFYYRALRP